VLKILDSEDKLNSNLFKLFDQQQRHRNVTYQILESIHNIQNLPVEIMDLASQRASNLGDMNFKINYESWYYLRKCSKTTHSCHEHPCKKF